MAQHSLGKVTATAGTPVRLTTNESDPTARYGAHSYLVEALSTNTGAVYIGSASLNRTTLAGVYAILPPPTTNSYPNFSATVTYAAAAFNLAEIYIDVDVSNEGALVSNIVA